MINVNDHDNCSYDENSVVYTSQREDVNKQTS